MILRGVPALDVICPGTAGSGARRPAPAARAGSNIMMSPAVSKIERTELPVDQVHDRLPRAILDRELPASTPLSVPELARRLGISRRSLDEHCEIQAAIAAGDPEIADPVTRRHIAAVRTRLAEASPTDEKRRTGA